MPTSTGVLSKCFEIRVCLFLKPKNETISRRIQIKARAGAPGIQSRQKAHLLLYALATQRKKANSSLELVSSVNGFKAGSPERHTTGSRGNKAGNPIRYFGAGNKRVSVNTGHP